MRVARVLAGFAGVAVLVPVVFAGCTYPEEVCEKVSNCAPLGAGATSTATGGNDAGTDPMCIPSQAEGAVDDKCGIFVSATVGNDANSGTKGSPVATIGHAILEANGTDRPIYVCNEAFTEVVEGPAGIEIYGGLDCANGWTWSEAGRTTLTAAADSVPLKLTSGMGVTRIENFTVTAADAMQVGGSSIAAIIDNVTAELAHCEFTAGAGRDGADGQTDMTPAEPGVNGQAGAAACAPVAMAVGGAGGMVTCDGATSQGGNGGNGGDPNADIAGQAGLPGQPGDVAGGTGQVDDAGACIIGQTGADGMPGIVGNGGTELGSLSISGIAGGNGQNGGAGTPGQGGGGGGGSKSGLFCGGSDGTGASGGGGGSGGCGGKGGGGGQSGGSSIALMSLNSALTLKQVTLTSGVGGKGGIGGVAQPGAQNGVGGPGGLKAINPSKPGCKGGDGGYGGDGGPGGGGRGGHSLGIAFRGTPPPAEGYTITPGTPGNGGVGATMDPTGAGANGMASPTPVEFP